MRVDAQLLHLAVSYREEQEQEQPLWVQPDAEPWL
jgi:hypothetical protein